MRWETPAYTEIEMNAEIGGYQDDFGEKRWDPDPESKASAAPAGASIDSSPRTT